MNLHYNDIILLHVVVVSFCFKISANNEIEVKIWLLSIYCRFETICKTRGQSQDQVTGS